LQLAKPTLLVGQSSSITGCPAVPQGYEPCVDTSDRALEPTIARSYKAPTSGGSTGRPKLIVSNRPATAEVLAITTSLFRIRPDDVILSTGPLYHNAVFSAALASIGLGCRVVVMNRFDASTALALIDCHRVSWMYAVPTMMHRIWRLPEEERSS